MTDEELGRELAVLGVDASSYRVLALLPLVQVAWADGAIQDAERDLILHLADSRYRLGDEGKRVLRNWLHHPPSAGFALRGRRVLRHLCDRNGYEDVTRRDLTDVIGLAKKVAQAAGGFFGFGAISSTEADTIDEIAVALGIDEDRPWSESDGPSATPIRPWAQPDEVTLVPADADRESPGPSVEVVFHDMAASPTSALLVHYDQARGDRTMPIPPSGITVGRAHSNPVQIQYDRQVSRCHCRLFTRQDPTGDRVYIEDLHSAAGTWVNGERIVERRLFGGEEIMVGSVVFFVQRAARQGLGAT